MLIVLGFVMIAVFMYLILSKRLNAGSSGFWLVGHMVTEGGAELAVALGWAPTRAQAVAAEGSATIASPLIGRYLPSEAPDQPDVDKGVQSAASIPSLINQWKHFGGSVYGGYVVASAAAPGLHTIDSPPPSQEVSLNWLNVFYAAEWAIWYAPVSQALGWRPAARHSDNWSGRTLPLRQSPQRCGRIAHTSEPRLRRSAARPARRP